MIGPMYLKLKLLPLQHDVDFAILTAGIIIQDLSRPLLPFEQPMLNIHSGREILKLRLTLL